MTSRILTTGGGSSAGQVAYFASLPEGWLKANGAAISREDYADLFASVGTTFGAGDGSTTFHLPDLRGEFVRCADDGRGVDAGRVVGSYQADELKSHSHNTYIENNSGAVMKVATSTYNSKYQATTATGGNETRPRNRALLACIKY